MKILLRAPLVHVLLLGAEHMCLSTRNVIALVLVICGGFASAAEPAADPLNTTNSKNLKLPVYTREQAEQGGVLYQQYCAACHGANLAGGAAPSLAGEAFYGKWGGHSVGDLLHYVTRLMPPGAPGVLNAEQYVQILAYLFQQGGISAGTEAMPVDLRRLQAWRLPIPAGGAAREEKIDVPPPPKPRRNPLERITPVADAMLANPPAEDWLMWRRTYDAHGFSPLKQVTARNVRRLTAVWSWSMPQGRNITTPLVHDGVMFMYANGGIIHALDAQTGELLWQYERALQKNITPFGLRAFAVHGDHVIFPAGDGHVVALEMKTGKVAWDTAVVDPLPYFSGGPLVADGKVLLGTSTATSPGYNFIVALDAKTGAEAWRFYTVARPGEAGGDTWNNLPVQERSGAGVWTPGSYDPQTNLAFFGTGNTYLAAGWLRKLAEGAASNDGLYMNSTLAFDPGSGRLAWYFQHLPNDQWNYDFAFERTVVALPIHGGTRRVVVTGGKPGIFDALKVEDGAYQFSLDLGLQNVVASIDPQTGARQISAAALPEKGETAFVCPSSHGARNWMPTAFDPQAHVLYIPFIESCMKLRSPPRPGDLILGDYGRKAWPRPDSDGHFGGLRAVNLQTRTTLWTNRWRAIPTSGVLLTAGGIAFVGLLDRTFVAYDAQTGDELWRVRLNDTPGGGPISFMAGGTQYIAITTGHSGARNVDQFMAPEIVNPQAPNATIWVFELRGR